MYVHSKTGSANTHTNIHILREKEVNSSRVKKVIELGNKTLQCETDFIL